MTIAPDSPAFWDLHELSQVRRQVSSIGQDGEAIRPGGQSQQRQNKVIKLESPDVADGRLRIPTSLYFARPPVRTTWRDCGPEKASWLRRRNS
jgi:hypothetical protein